jgi:hypothetical protein
MVSSQAEADEIVADYREATDPFWPHEAKLCHGCALED